MTSVIEKHETGQQLLDAVELMPELPKSVREVLRLSNDATTSQKELVDVIKRDPVFTLKMLRLVNSPYFGLSREITSINHASVYLGLNTLKNVAVGLGVVGIVPHFNPAGLEMGAFWLHSLAVASGTRMLGAMLGVSRDEAADYFAAGLLHDVGKVVMALHAPEQFSKVREIAIETDGVLSRMEMEHMGMTHSEIGGLLAEKWNLPKGLKDALQFHHTPLEGKPSQLVDCVFVADQIAKKLAFGSAGDYTVLELPQPIQDRFSLDLNGLIKEMGSLDEEVENARIFIQLGEPN